MHFNEQLSRQRIAAAMLAGEERDRRQERLYGESIALLRRQHLSAKQIAARIGLTPEAVCEIEDRIKARRDAQRFTFWLTADEISQLPRA